MFLDLSEVVVAHFTFVRGQLLLSRVVDQVARTVPVLQGLLRIAVAALVLSQGGQSVLRALQCLLELAGGRDALLLLLLMMIVIVSEGGPSDAARGEHGLA